MKGKVIDDPQDIAKGMNDFFVNVGPSTEKTLPKTGNITPEKFLRDKNRFEFITAHISEDEILKIIHSLPIKSTGPSSIPIRLLKLVASNIVTPLCHIINVSFTTGVFPDIWKIAKVIALHSRNLLSHLQMIQENSLNVDSPLVTSYYNKEWVMHTLHHNLVYFILKSHNK